MDVKNIITYNGRSSDELGVIVGNFPAIPIAQKTYKEFTVPGRNGLLRRDEKTVEDIEFGVQLLFIAEPGDIGDKMREVIAWIYGDGDHKLTFAKDHEWYYKVKRVDLSPVEYKGDRAGMPTATFICEGYRYAHIGDQPTKIFRNDWEESHPIYEISGNGACTLTVNGKTFKATVGQNLTIDTDLMESFRTDGTIMNTSVTGDYADLYLKHGDNTIAITNGFTVVVYPRWRAL